MNLHNVSLPTHDQWRKVAKAAAFSFVSAFLGTFTAAGGIQSTYEATITLAFTSIISAINVVLYSLWITLFEGGKS